MIHFGISYISIKKDNIKGNFKIKNNAKVRGNTKR